MTTTKTDEELITRKIRRWLILFITCLVLSGITAFPLETELQIAVSHIGVFPQALQSWLINTYTAIKVTNQHYPYLSYGTDWLAFAHIVIAIAFIGPLRDPVKNVWVIEFGLIACALVPVLAFTAGSIRHIPVYWRLIDCSFSLAVIPLYICYRCIKNLEYIHT